MHSYLLQFLLLDIPCFETILILRLYTMLFDVMNAQCAAINLSMVVLYLLNPPPLEKLVFVVFPSGILSSISPFDLSIIGEFAEPRLRFLLNRLSLPLRNM